MDLARHDQPHPALRSLAWIIIIAATSLALSRAFACAMPFAAMAAIAGAQLGRREAVMAVLLGWIGNQAIGFSLLGYPHTWDTFAWGGAIGLAALASALIAAAASSVSTSKAARGVVALSSAFIAYEGVLFAATFVLPTAGHPFAPEIIARIFAINVVAFAGLLVLHRIVVGFGLLPTVREPRVSRQGTMG